MIIKLLLLLFFLLASAFFAGMETGIVAINPLRLQHMLREKIRGAKILNFFTGNTDYLLGTTLVGNNICNVALSIISAKIGEELLGASGAVVAGVMITLLLLIFGEYLPKAWFQSYPAMRTRTFAPLLRLCGFLFYPIGKAATFITSILFPMPKGFVAENAPIITRDELVKLTSAVGKSGEISHPEHSMIHQVFEMSHTSCSAVMIPFKNIQSVASDTSREKFLAKVRQHGYSRWPVYDNEQKCFAGFINAFDVLIDTKGKDRQLSDYIRPPQFVEKHVPVDELLPCMRLSRQPMVLVTKKDCTDADRASNVIGLITIEDVLQRIDG